jgi:hypothetical protein
VSSGDSGPAALVDIIDAARLCGALSAFKSQAETGEAMRQMPDIGNLTKHI